jgi:DNA-binding CsgD family transcriptional regulator
MGMRTTAEAFIGRITSVSTVDDLETALHAICEPLGFEWFALSHHIDVARAGGAAIRLHNYPERWADYYDANGFGVTDPVHRASHVTSVGFAWSRLPEMIPLTPHDRAFMALGRQHGIGDGFTVPAHVPGEARGSCSFANGAGRRMPHEMLPIAQLVGAFAFEGARRVWPARQFDPLASPCLTDRQRDCMLWVARGKSDWEISRLLGISEETVTRHVKQACERYGVNKRTLAVIRTLFDGTLTFGDIFWR